MSIASHWMTRELSQGGLLRPSRAIWPLLAVCVLGLWPSIASLARTWRDVFEYHHGILIVAITIGWLWKIRRDIDACDARPVRAALPLIVLALVAWTVAYRANSELLQQMLVPVIPLLAVYAICGPQVCRRVAAPLAYLYFAIPVWDQLLPFLQWLTTTVAEWVLGVMGVPTQVEGHHVTIPSGRFSIIEGCSGKRFLVIALAFAALAAAIEGLRWRRTLYLLAVATCLALITNWLRVVTVIYAGHVTQMQHYLVAHEHKSFGYALFVPMLFAILWSARSIRRRQAAASALPMVPAAEHSGRPIDWAVVMVSIALPIVVWGRAPERGATVHLGALPVATGRWQGPLPADLEWQPKFVNPAEELRASYSVNGQRVEIYLNVYALQTQGSELVFHRNSVAPAERFTMMRRLPRPAGAPPAIVVRESSGRRWVVAQMYEVGGRPTASPGLAQVYYGLHAIVRPVPAGTLASAVRCAGDCNSAEQAIDDFWREHSGELMELIPDR
jgi:exosortase A